jgi:hypothetical protein
VKRRIYLPLAFLIVEQQQMERTYDTAEAADFLRLESSTLRKWRSLGKGPRFHKIGHGRHGDALYFERDLLDYIGPARQVIPSKQAA